MLDLAYGGTEINYAELNPIVTLEWALFRL